MPFHQPHGLPDNFLAEVEAVARAGARAIMPFWRSAALALLSSRPYTAACGRLMGRLMSSSVRGGSSGATSCL